MRVLVTGGAGFVGSALVKRLLEEGHQVGVLDDFSRGREDRVPLDAEVFAADIRDAKAVMGAVNRYDTIFHLAYVQGTQTFTEDPARTIEVALKGMMNVLDACDGSAIITGRRRDLILVSSSEAYQVPPEGMTPTPETVPLSVPDPTNPRYAYGGGKIASEIATLAYSQAEMLNRAVIVRIHNAVGPDMGREHVIPQFAVRAQWLVRGADEPYEFRIQGSGTESRCFCHIDDCVDGLMLLLEKGKDRNVYHLGTDEEVTIFDLARRVLRYYGVSDPTIVPSELPKGSPPRRVPDITKMRALGYKPTRDLEQILSDTLEWYAAYAK